MSRIAKIETWMARRPDAPGESPSDGERLIRKRKHGATYVVVRLTAEDGTEGYGGIAVTFAPDATISYVHDAIAPYVLGRSAHDRELIYQDLYHMNRNLVFFPLFLPGPVDVALWDIAAKQAGLPLYKYIGAYRDRVPAYASSQFMPEIESYLQEARRYSDLGVAAYKAHPGGSWRRHLEIAEALRSEFPSMTLMLDPVGSEYSLATAIKVGRVLERLDFHWLEEPFQEYFVSEYAELCRTLDISVCATEAVYGGPAGVAQFIASGAADIVRADVAWRWGVTGTLKCLHLAESFGLNCELHTTMGALDIVNLHVACAAKNSEFFELYAPHEVWHFPFNETVQLDSDGCAVVPDVPGTGLTVDWDIVDDTTLVRSESSA